MPSATLQAPVAVWLSSGKGRLGLARSAGLVLAGTALLALAAHVQVPFWPVKLSMQTLAVMLIGTCFGARLAGATLLAYLLEGASGLPVFQSGAGLAYMAGPTAGYLLGYLLAAVMLGAAAERGAFGRPTTAVLAALAAVALIYAPGVAWLAVLFGAGKCLQYGLTPFVPGEALKVALFVALASRIPSLKR